MPLVPVQFGLVTVKSNCMTSGSTDCLMMSPTAFYREIESVASELERMSAGSCGRLTVPTADGMRLQLDDMLEQRTAAEAFQAEVHRHRRTASLLEEEGSKLRVAKSEVGPLPKSKPGLSVILCLSACMTVHVFADLTVILCLSAGPAPQSDCFCCCSAPYGATVQHHSLACPLLPTSRTLILVPG